MTSSFIPDLDKFPLYKKLPNGRELIFIHITKTAGTSIKQFFNFPPASRIAEDGYLKHYTVQQLRNLIAPEVWQRAFVFTFIRNPWDRLHSFYRYRNTKRQRRGKRPIPLVFNAWAVKKCNRRAEDSHNMLPQSMWLDGIDETYQLDFMGRFENLELDFKYICQQVGYPVDDLINVNPSIGNSDYRAAYQADGKAAVAKLYQADIVNFGYEF